MSGREDERRADLHAYLVRLSTKIAAGFAAGMNVERLKPERAHKAAERCAHLGMLVAIEILNRADDLEVEGASPRRWRQP